MNQLNDRRKVIGLFIGLFILVYLGSQQAQAAWTSKESSRVKALEVRIKELETLVVQKSASYEMKTIRYLATEPTSGTYKDICTGIENLDGGESYSYIGRLAPKTDIFGKPATDLYGKEVTYPVYRCKLTFWVPKL